MERPEPKFVPGELVEIAMSFFHPHLVGTKFLIEDMRWARSTITGESTWFYGGVGCRIHEPRGEAWAENQLRKLPPNEPTTFDASIWQPKEVETKTTETQQ